MNELHRETVFTGLMSFRRSSMDLAEYAEGYMSGQYFNLLELGVPLVKPSLLMAMLRYFERP